MRAIALRIAVVVVALGLWFWTQSLIGARTSPSECVGDGLHQLTAGVNRWLAQVPRRADLLLILSSLVIDAVGDLPAGSQHLRAHHSPVPRPARRSSRSGRPLQGLTALPPPEGMIWHYPGVPSLLVTYGVATDLFFSGHTAIAVWGGLEIERLPFRGAGARPARRALRSDHRDRPPAHYTMDVFTGVVVALLVTAYADRWARPIDQWLDRIASPS